MLAIVLCGFCAIVPAGLASASAEGGPASNSSASASDHTLSRHAISAAREHHGLPAGATIPSWAEKGEGAYFLPAHAKRGKHLAKGKSSDSEGPIAPDERSIGAPTGEDTGENELGARCTGSYCPPPPLRYLGGLVQHEPNVHIIYWGSNWNKEPGTAAKTMVSKMFEGLNKSTYQEILSQYFDATGRISASVSVDTFTDSRVGAPEKVGFSSMESEITYALGEKGTWKREPNAQFILVTAPGSTYASGFGEFCAYHDIDSKGGIYSFVPYAGDAPFGTEDNCDGYYGGGDAAKATSVMASHEYAESATDPRWYTEPGWKDLEGYELSDMCATPYDELANGTIVQGQYDDHQNACSLSDKEPPQVLALTEAATAVSKHSATLNATINPESLETTYHFEYGTTTSYGTSVPAKDLSAGSGRSNVKVQQSISGLSTEQVYHYRIAATNSSGTTYGEDGTFVPSLWTIRPQGEPTRTGHSWLNDVACPTREACVAVGHYYNSGGKALSYVGASQAWQWKALPAPEKGSLTDLEGVSCSSASACTAVGRGEVSGKVVPMAARWNGTEWSLQSVPVPAETTYGILYDVSCLSSTECMAVGTYKNSEGVFIDYSARWSGGAWSTLTTPTPKESTQSLLKGVACPGTNLCVAAGWYGHKTNGASKVTMTWNGTSWTEVAPASSGGWFVGLDCASTTYCVAVGGWETVVEVWNGSKWTAQTTPTLSEANDGYLEGISCVSSSACTATGGAYSKINGSGFTLAETWDGSSWKVQTTPRESELIRNELWGAACVGTPKRCVAVGGSVVSGRWEPLLETEPDRQPIAETEAATGIAAGKATLNATVNPNGAETSYRFEYGTTTSYGTKVPIPDKAIGSGESDVEVNQTPSGLKASTTYHYRVVATNAEGTTYGQDKTFVTGGGPKFSLSFGETGFGEGQLRVPLGLATDSAGNVYVAEEANHRIQKFNSKGEPLFKFGAPGTGEGQFSSPQGVAVDSSGNIWVSDTGNDRIQKFNSEGEFLSEFGSWGTGNGQFHSPAGIAVDASGNIWVVDSGNSRIQKFNSSGTYLSQFGTSGSGNGQLKFPQSLAIDSSGNIWVADSGNSRIQKFNSSGTYQSQFGTKGSGDGQFKEWAFGIAIDSAGGLWVSDSAGNRVQRFNSSGEYLSQFGSSGSGEGQLSGSTHLAVDPSGNVWVADTNNNRVQKWVPNRPAATTGSASGVTDKAATLNGTVNPNGLATEYRFEYGTTTSYGTKVPVPDKAIGSGESNVEASQGASGLKASTTYHFRLAATNVEGTAYGEDKTFTTSPENYTFSAAYGTEGSGNGQFSEPHGVAIDSSGNVWVTDSLNDRVQKFNSKGEYLSQFGGTGTGNGKLSWPQGIAIDASGNLWVADSGNNRVQKFNSKGEYVSKFGSAGSGNGQFYEPIGIAIDSSGNVWVIDSANNRVQKFNSSGTYQSQFGKEGSGNGQFSEPHGIAIDSSGNLWVADSGNNRVQKFNSSGTYQAQFGSLGFGDGQFTVPVGLALTPAGHILVSDSGIRRVQQFNSSGTYLSQFGSSGSGNGQFLGIGDIAVDGSGDLWIVDPGNNRVQKWAK